MTPELVRDYERADAAVKEGFGALAVTADGAAAGFTELQVNRHRPTIGFQGDTVVVAAHRGHRLGRWLKAANLLQVLDAHPGLRTVTTDNADSNEHMLAINEAMGYRELRTVLTAQGSPDVARTYLRGRMGEVASRT
jgi:hypothetical protein